MFSHSFSRIPFMFMLWFLWVSCFLIGSGLHQWFQHRTILANSWTPGDIVCPRLPFKAIPSSQWIGAAGTGESKQSALHREFCTRANTGWTATCVCCSQSYVTFPGAPTAESRATDKCYHTCSIIPVTFYYFNSFHADYFVLEFFYR